MDRTGQEETLGYGNTGPATGGMTQAGYGSGGAYSGYPAGEGRGSGSGESSPSRTEEIGDKAQETLTQAKDVAQETVGTVMQQAQDQASLQVSNGLDQAAGLVGSLADAVESVSQQLRQSDQRGLADYTGRAAHQLDRFSAYLEECEVEDIVSEVEHYARRQPAIFLGGAFGLGFLAVRFLKSSAPRSRPGYQPRRTESTRPRLARTASPASPAIPEAGTVPPMSPGTGRPASAGPSDRVAGPTTGYSGQSTGGSDPRRPDHDLPQDYTPTV